MTQLNKVEEFVFKHFFVGDAKAFLFTNIKEAELFTLPQPYIDFIGQARQFSHILNIQDMRESFIDAYIRDTLCPERIFADKKMVSHLIELVSAPFPIRKFHKDIGLYGDYIVHYTEKKKWLCFYNAVADTICYHRGYRAGLCAMKAVGLETPPGFDKTATEHIEGIMFQCKPHFEVIKKYLAEEINERARLFHKET